MLRMGSEESARAAASEDGLAYGWSVFCPSGWYVGTPEELRAIGVIDPSTPAPGASTTRADDAREVES